MSGRNLRKIYELVAERDSGLCRVCGQPAADVHHIVFRSHGGKDSEQNLICLCRKHHEQAHNDEPVWRDKLLAMNQTIYGKIETSEVKHV